MSAHVSNEAQIIRVGQRSKAESNESYSNVVEIYQVSVGGDDIEKGNTRRYVRNICMYINNKQLMVATLLP